jgi:hypothetical protein
MIKLVPVSAIAEQFPKDEQMLVSPTEILFSLRLVLVQIKFKSLKKLHLSKFTLLN